MAICDSKLFFSRAVKVFVEPLDAAGATQSEIWEIPVLDGFSFAQANNSSEIVLAEMESAAGVSRRGKRMFNDSLAPAEWSFSTYTRPFKSAAGGSPDADSVANIHAVEEVLWALAAGKAIRSGKGWASGGTDYFTLDTVSSIIDFNTSNTSALGIANIYFVLEDSGLIYKVREATVNEATINFDIDGIAMIEWSGMGAEIVDATGADITTGLINEAITSTDNFIRNRLTSMTVQPVKNAEFDQVTVAGGAWPTGVYTITEDGNAYPVDGAGQLYTIPGGNNDAVVTYEVASGVVTAAEVTTAGTGYTDGLQDAGFFNPSNYTTAQAAVLADAYSLTLTGGSISLSNNISYITPEELGIVNIPIGHVTGNRSVSGTFTNYLVQDVGSDVDSESFWADAKALTTVVTHSFALDFQVGGASGTPRVQFAMPFCHVEIPTHAIEDVISLETSFTALGECISSADEFSIIYTAV
jgi:hypothetical protein